MTSMSMARSWRDCPHCGGGRRRGRLLGRQRSVGLWP
jgi:hypothetical protein